MFAVYQVLESSSEWRLLKIVPLARILVERILEEAQVRAPSPEGRMPWEISGSELCQRVVQESIPDRDGVADRCRLVIDATYTQSYAHLFEICYVWGIADPEWSPLALRLAQLHEAVDRPTGRATPLEQFKPQDDCASAKDYVHEFLYLQHGYLRGTQKNWGRTGYTNAALLWRPHLEHLLEKMGYTSREV
jgi:hypothetical protein